MYIGRAVIIKTWQFFRMHKRTKNKNKGGKKNEGRKRNEGGRGKKDKGEKKNRGKKSLRKKEQGWILVDEFPEPIFPVFVKS